jgi:hypothetical protein
MTTTPTAAELSRSGGQPNITTEGQSLVLVTTMKRRIKLYFFQEHEFDTIGAANLIFMIVQILLGLFAGFWAACFVTLHTVGNLAAGDKALFQIGEWAFGILSVALGLIAGVLVVRMKKALQRIKDEHQEGIEFSSGVRIAPS